jgi:plasmid stability protein
MRRTQLYLDDGLWNALHARAASEKTSVSELVREAVRERYFSPQEQQRRSMKEFVGIRKESTKDLEAVDYVRTLRRSSRLERLRSR